MRGCEKRRELKRNKNRNKRQYAERHAQKTQTVNTQCIMWRDETGGGSEKRKHERTMNEIERHVQQQTWKHAKNSTTDTGHHEQHKQISNLTPIGSDYKSVTN